MNDDVLNPDEALDEAIEELTGYSVDELNEIRLESEDGAVRLINMRKVEMMEFCVAAIKKAIAKTGRRDLKITHGRRDISPTTGYVSVEGVSIDIDEFEWFARAAEFAHNMEVYALANGKVRMTFTFYDVTERIK